MVFLQDTRFFSQTLFTQTRFRMNIRRNTILIFILLCVVKISCSQTYVHIYGFVKDQQSGEVLPGASIYDTVMLKGVIADYNGYFNIKVAIPSILKISYVGYDTKTFAITHAKDTFVNILLITSNTLAEVVVTEKRRIVNNLSSLSQKELTQIPSLGGKPDVSKALQLLPGINTQKEGSSLLQVRGGDPGQNLYLFDNVPIIYVNHLGGFMSVFNPDIINNIDVYKGAFPARYGGKLSSVVDITQKKGNVSDLNGNIGAGLTDVSFCVEGPTKIDNSSFIITGRKTLTDLFMFLISSISEGNNYSIAYGFHDINSKFTWNPNEKNSINLNLYYGDDNLRYWQTDKTEKHKLSNVWGNVMLAGHWNYVINSKLYIKTYISYCRYRLKNKYDYTLTNNLEQTDYFKKNLSAVSDISINSSLKHSLFKNLVNEYGIKSSLLSYLPFYSTHSKKESGNKNNLYSNETAVYASTKLSFLKYSNIEAGVRGVGFYSNDYTDYSIEPRINMNLGINKQHSLNAGYMNTKQYTHLLLATGAIMLNEVWFPASKGIPASTVEQYTVGYNGDYRGFQMQVELFYKDMADLAIYKDGYTAFEGDKNWQSKVEPNGLGTAKGVELYIKKTTGKITGFAAYSISKAIRQYPNINLGKEFLFDYDRTHTFSIFAHYKITENVDLNLTWIYQTGLPYTPAIGKAYSPSVEGDGTVYYEKLIYGERNSERMSDYHRLDVGINYTKITRRNRKSIWSFSVYNLYNRQNPYYYYFNTNNTSEIIIPEAGSETLPLKLYQMSFFPIIPSISYKVFFENDNNKTQKNRNFFKKWLYQEN
jgi:hypothetical protein